MNTNTGKIDRILRLAAVAVIYVFYFSGQLTGLTAIFLFLFSIVLLFTAAFGSCPIYRLFGITTLRRAK